MLCERLCFISGSHQKGEQARVSFHNPLWKQNYNVRKIGIAIELSVADLVFKTSIPIFSAAAWTAATSSSAIGSPR